MGLDERDYVRGNHPSACTCVGCQRRRLRRGYGDDPVEKRQAILSVSRRRHAQINFKPLIVWLITVALVFGSIFALGWPVAPEPTPEYPPTQPVITPEPAPEYPPSEPVITPEPAPEPPPTEPVITPEPVPEPPPTEPVITPEPAPEPPATEPVITPEPAPEPPPTEPAIPPKPGPRDIVEEANFEAIDYHALNVPGLGWECVESLANYLTEPARNDLERARAISRWIVQNISYDMEDLLDDTFRRDQSAKATLLRGYAVCEGYARLFEALAYAAGLEVAYLIGWARGGAGYEIGDPADESPNHAWNAVRIDGGWYLLDVTWADKDYCGQFKEFYFLTCPTELIYSHFPRNPDWQLREIPISKQEFTELPRLGPAFFQKGLELVTHTQSVIKTEQQVTINIMVPADILLLVELSQDDQNLPRRLTFAQRKGEKYRIDAVFPRAGDYILRVFARDKDEEEDFEWVLDYKIIVSEGMPGPIGFPVVGRAFFEYGLDFDSHTQGIIEVDYQLTVTLQVPAGVSLRARLYENDERLPRRLTFVQRKGEKYRIDAVFPRAGDYILRVFARHKENEERFEWVLDYKIIVSEGMSGHIGFPVIFEIFHERGVYLYTPRSGYLQSGTSEQFKLRVPGARSVAVMIGEQRHHLTKYDELFKGVVDIAKGEIRVIVLFPDESHYYGVLQYTGL